MNIILLSGGSGKRLWPLSNDIRSKQFIKFFKKDDGTYELVKSFKVPYSSIVSSVQLLSKGGNIVVSHP